MNIVQAIMFMMPMAKFHFNGTEMPEGGWTYEDIIWDDLFFPKPSKEQLQEAYKMSEATYASGSDYRTERRDQYPTAEEQLAIIFDIGIDGWKKYIENVKKNIPKPEVE